MGEIYKSSVRSRFLVRIRGPPELEGPGALPRLAPSCPIAGVGGADRVLRRRYRPICAARPPARARPRGPIGNKQTAVNLMRRD
ncbi:hypothetical protein EVAR_63808_1 [Eumeta japonica]|uniref:Uncharacterized protein n=1 Tax=Eumeta variegata TaxID=151549 RepID=A0A4C2A0Z3_EUMVA|nr:hypothetical protein EVAR_63808_1 [Eumeta japonica]